MEELKVASLHHIVESAPQDAVAIIDKGKTFSFADINLAVSAYRELINHCCPIQPRQRVAFFDVKSVEQVALIFAAWSLGAVIVPINPTLKSAQVQHILNDSQASLFITSAPRLKAAADDFLLQTEGLTVGLIGKSDLVQSPRVFSIPAVDEINHLAGGPPINTVQPDPNALAALLYTSGSTGMPKGVMVSQKNLLLGAGSVAAYLGLSCDDRVMALLPFSFDYGLNQLLSSWYVGASVVLHNFFLPGAVAADLTKYEVTGLAGVPPLWRQLLKPLTSAGALKLRFVTNSGGALTLDIIHALNSLHCAPEIYAMYGLTEAFRSTYLAPSLLHQKPASSGQAVPHARIYILDDYHQPCAAHQKGQLVHAGPLVALGYWNKPEQTEQRFMQLPTDLAEYEGEKAVFSGDLAWQDEDGDIYIEGRLDEQIKTSGYRVSPNEVEALAQSIEGVEQVACLSVKDEAIGQAIIIVYQGSVLSNHDFLTAYKALAPNYLWPKKIHHVSHIPLNANGKVDRVSLSERYCHVTHH